MIKLCSLIIKKVAIAYSYSKKCGLYWLKDSIKVTLKSLLLLVNMEKSSKSDEWLQNKCFLWQSLCPLWLSFQEDQNSAVFARSDFKIR